MVLDPRLETILTAGIHLLDKASGDVSWIRTIPLSPEESLAPFQGGLDQVEPFV